LASQNKNLLAMLFSLMDSFFPDPELFSDLASENSLLLASLLANVWKNLSTPLITKKISIE
jgi:hypothetical protein